MWFFIFLICLVSAWMIAEIAVGFKDMSIRAGSDDHWIAGAAGLGVLAILLIVMLL